MKSNNQRSSKSVWRYFRQVLRREWGFKPKNTQVIIANNTTTFSCSINYLGHGRVIIFVYNPFYTHTRLNEPKSDSRRMEIWTGPALTGQDIRSAVSERLKIWHIGMCAEEQCLYDLESILDSVRLMYSVRKSLTDEEDMCLKRDIVIEFFKGNHLGEISIDVKSKQSEKTYFRRNDGVWQLHWSPNHWKNLSLLKQIIQTIISVEMLNTTERVA